MRDAPLRIRRDPREKKPSLAPLIALAVGLLAIVACIAVARGEEQERPEGKYGYPTAPEAFHPSYVRGHCWGPRGTDWVAEYIDAERLANPVPRKGFTFKADPEVPKEFRVTPADYTGTGRDRGHWGNFADGAFSKDAAAATFLMSNMSPQTKRLNEGHTKWEGLESWLRDQARDHHAKVIVISGPAFLPGKDGNLVIETVGDKHLWCETHCFKTAVLEYPHDKLTIKNWLMPNTESPPDFSECELSTDRLEGLVGLNFWPLMEEKIQDELEASEPETADVEDDDGRET